MIKVSRRNVLLMGGAGAMPLVWAPAGNAASGLPAVTAFRNPGCGCCEKWAELLKLASFEVTMTDDPALDERRARLGVPADIAGCHTAQMGDYIIEGHVPLQDILRFLTEKPAARGLAVAGMPMGSSGMETDGPADLYDVLIFMADGSSKLYARH
jgi:hypothetical protein